MRVTGNATRYVNVKSYRTATGRPCVHCGRSSYVTADRKRNGYRMALAFCRDHASERGVS